MSRPVTMVLLTVASSPEVPMPPATGTDQKNKERKKQSDNKREFGFVLCRDIAGLSIEVE
jgi:hypothetical protein